MRVFSTWVLGTVLGCLISATDGRAAQPIGLDELPVEVKEFLKQKFPAADRVKAVLEPGQHIEVTLQDKNGTKIELLFKAEVSYRLNTAEAGKDALPIKVANILERHYRGYKVKSWERLLDAKNETIGYRVVFDHGKRTGIEVTIKGDRLYHTRKKPGKR